MVLMLTLILLEHQQGIPRGVHVVSKPELRIHTALSQSTPRIFLPTTVWLCICNIAMFECDELSRPERDWVNR